jgi:hypothetical protein
MDQIKQVVNKNPFRDHCVPAFTKAKRENITFETKETLWNATVSILEPAVLATAWVRMNNPILHIGQAAQAATVIRDSLFALQQEAATSLRGNRKLSKVKVADALAAVKPNTDQTKIIAQVLYALKRIQTVCFNEEKKEVWTVPEDLRVWSGSMKTMWVDSKYERSLDWEKSQSFGQWISNREAEAWKIEWPISDGTFEEIKQKMADEFSHITVHSTDGKKPKKEDYAKSLGRCEAVRHLTKLTNQGLE